MGRVKGKKCLIFVGSQKALAISQFTTVEQLSASWAQPGANLSRPGTIRPCNPAVDNRAIETPYVPLEVSDLTYEAEA